MKNKTLSIVTAFALMVFFVGMGILMGMRIENDRCECHNAEDIETISTYPPSER